MRNAAPELVARTAGFTGVFLSLIVIGFWDRPEFIITPQQHFESVILTLHQNAPENETPTSEKAPVAPEPEKKQEPEPKLELESKPVPDTVTPPPASKPLIQEIKQEIKPQPEPEQVKNPEPPVKKEPPKEQKPKAAPDHKPMDKPKKVETKAQPPVLSDKSKVTDSAADKASVAPRSNAVEQKLQQRQAQAQLSSILVQEIKNRLKYPRNAVRRRLEGTVMMEFTVKDGVVISFKISKSSGHKILDEAARKLAQTFVSFNTGLPSGNSLILIPVKYELL